MGLDSIIRDVTTGVGAGVNADNEQLVALTTDVEAAGYVGLAGINDLGTVTGFVEARHVRVSELNRLNVGVDSILMNDAFNYTAQNMANYGVYATTQTVALAAGYKTVNASNVTTINTNSAWQTRRPFAMFGGFELKVDVNALHTVPPQLGAVTEWGLLSATLPGAAAPTDGAFFRFTSGALFKAVISYGGVETLSPDLPIPTENENHKYRIIIDQIHAEFWVDGVMVHDVDTPSGQGQPISSPALPFTVRHYIAGSAPALPMQFKTATVDVSLADMNTTKPWPHVMAGQGLSSYQGQNGSAMGSTANYANNANPTAAVPTNTTAALGVGLGGQFWETASLALTVDGIICSYQNPAATATLPGRTLYITSVKISSYIQTVIAGGPFVKQWSLAFGHTALPLTTAEAANGKAPRRVPLGNQLITAAQAVSTLVTNDVSATFDAPIVVYPGEFIAAVTKHVGTVGTSGTIAHMITFTGYFE